jgi:CRISPR-associated protein Cmr4
MKNNLISLCTFYAISPLHAGCGAATSQVDLPIQRERHTNWPHIQASGVKGAFRAHYRLFAGDKLKMINIIFGSDEQNDSQQQGAKHGLPGAISVSDAHLLAFPMRSNIAPFVMVTCPAVLQRLNNNLEFTGKNPITIPELADNDKAVVLYGQLEQNTTVLLEDVLVTTQGDTDFKFPDGFPQPDNLLLISNATFDYCVSSCTEIQTQIKIDSEKGTTKDGSLRYQELLPADTILYSVVYFTCQYAPEMDNGGAGELNSFQAQMIKEHVQEVINGFIQIGGDETLGRGICKLNWID